MYPKLYLDYFRDFNRTSEVFIAMPFAKEFEPRWKNIIRPGIEATGLKPYRVDVRRISDSILTDILAGIARARFILADTSFQESDGRQLAPNPNVMYELGIAHAMRLPEEVIVIRDKRSKDGNPFDIGHIRYTSFDPEQEAAARRTVQRLIEEAQKAVEVTRDRIVERTLQTLDPDGMWFLGTVGHMSTFDLYPFDPDRKGLYGLGYRDSSETELRTIARDLITLGLIESGGDPGPPERRVYGAVPEYRVTPLGKAVFERLPNWFKEEGI
ncbi:MAG: hypothetical protein ACYTEW_17855 [Planctomycetota bacterium]|jgi:hypothetical protein